MARPRLSRRRIWFARGLAVAVDALQIVFLPAFGGGVAEPVDAAVDVATAIAQFWLLGWHPALLPGFLAELVPFVDLAPTWTVAVMIATAGRAATEGGPPASPAPESSAPPPPDA